MKPAVLATDLDGTLIPLKDNAHNVADLLALSKQLSELNMQLIFVTGRHLASVAEVIREAGLPAPKWIIGDVGTSIYQRLDAHPAGSTASLTDAYTLVDAYASELERVLGDFTVERMAEVLRPIEPLRLQEPEKQSRFKLSYYVEHEQLQSARQQIEQRVQAARAPYSLVVSIDPFTNEGLVDLLPNQVTKAYGLAWWANSQGIQRSEILYAGDSGNDSAVFAAGFRSIVVGNAHAAVRQAAEKAHAEAGWTDRLYAAELPATSGVLAGVRHYLLT